MNLHSHPGDKVVFKHPENGYDIDRENAAKHLKLGETYTIAKIEVHSFHTNVWLKEAPGVVFNSVHFDDARG